jgi:autotransporter-associated beta strand protein
MKPTRFFPLLAGLCSFQMQLTAAPSIGVNFVNGGDHVNNGAADSLGPAESAGAPTFAQINWNNLGRWGQDVVLNPTAGTSGVKVHWDSIGTWTNGAANATGDGKLMSGYLDASWGTGANSTIAPGTSVYGVGNNNKPMVFVGSIQSWLGTVNATTYSVVLYFDGDSADGSRTAEFWLQDVAGASSSMTVGADLTPHIFAADTANFSGTYTQATSTAETGASGGNFIVFTGLTADQFLIRGEEHGWASDAITGFQIIADPGEVIPEGSYWKGTASNSWTGANWTSDLTGAGSSTGLAPDYPVVTFAATGATNLATVLGDDQAISKLALTNGVGAVQIGGTHNLTLGYLGISVEAGTGPLTINTSGQVILEGLQTWINNAAEPLTVNSVISGDFQLTTAGGSTTLLTAANLHTGGTTVQSGTLKITTAAAVGSGPLIVNGVLDIGGINPTFGNLSGSGTVQNSTASACSLTLDVSADSTYACQIKDGPGGGLVSLVKKGTANVTSTGASNFTGSVTIENGQFNANYPNYGGAPTTSSLGNLQIPGRTITVTSPGSLRLTNNNIFGNQNANPSLLPEVIVNATTVSATSYNLIGDITLNSATLSQSMGNGWADYQGYQFRGLVRVVKDLLTPGPSLITGTSNGGNHLSANTIFEVEDVDDDVGVDLTVSAPLINPSGDFGYPAARGGFTKTGAGTMLLSGASTYTGNTVVSEGTLALSTPSLSDTRTISVASGARLQLDFPVENSTDTVGCLVLDGVTKPNGTYGAIGSGAGEGFESALITGTGFIQVIGLPDAFADWIATFTSLTGPNAARGADPDGDGLTNIQEFAFNSIPDSGAASGKIRSSVETITGEQALVLTLPVRNGAAFTGNTPAAIATVSDDYDDDLGYRIEGTNDMSAFDQQVSVVNPAVSAGLPALDTGWTYRSFRLNGNIGGATPRGPEGFLRAVVIDTP